MQPAIMKHCKMCDTVKSLSEFNKNKARVDGVQTCCRECSKNFNNQGYVSNSNSNRRDSIKSRRDKNRKHNTKLMQRYKRFCGCRICGENEPVALDLHHLDPTIKDMNPSSMVSYSTESLKIEIRKCVVVCSNCHRKIHANLIQI